MKTLNKSNAIRALVDLAPPLLERHFAPDCCIAATRVALGVLSRLGIIVRPQPTQLYIYTPNLWARIAAEKFNGTFLDGEWSVGVGMGEDLRQADSLWKGYAGHLIALAENCGDQGESCIIDLSIGQASRPQKGIDMPDATMIWRKAPLRWPVGTKINGCVCRYHLHNNPDFTASKDWRLPERTARLIETILKMMGI